MKYDLSYDKVKEAVENSINYTETLLYLGIPRRGNNIETIKSRIEKYNLDCSHFTGRARVYRNPKPIDINKQLSNGSYLKSSKLKEILFQHGLKENKCEVCGISEWMGKELRCQIHHINGVNNDNRLENLQILCPNCHSQTDTYCGNKNKPKNSNRKKCPICGKEISNKANYCTLCSVKFRRKVNNRPPLEDLLDSVRLYGYAETGRKYGVTHNAIKRWIRAYQKE